MGDREVAFELLARLKEEEALSSVLVHCYDYCGKDIPAITGKSVPMMNFIEYHARQVFDGRRRDRRDGAFVGPRLHGVGFKVPLPTQSEIDASFAEREARLSVLREERADRKRMEKLERASRRARLIREMREDMPEARGPVRYSINIRDKNNRRLAGMPLTHSIGPYILGCSPCNAKNVRLFDLLILPQDTCGTEDSVLIPIGCLDCERRWLQPVPTLMLDGRHGRESDSELIVERIEP